MINLLPVEVYDHIISYVTDAKDLSSVKRVCKLFHALAWGKELKFTRPVDMSQPIYANYKPKQLISLELHECEESDTTYITKCLHYFSEAKNLQRLTIQLLKDESDVKFGNFFPLSHLREFTLITSPSYQLNLTEFFNHATSLETLNCGFNPHRFHYDAVGGTNQDWSNLTKLTRLNTLRAVIKMGTLGTFGGGPGTLLTLPFIPSLTRLDVMSYMPWGISHFTDEDYDSLKRQVNLRSLTLGGKEISCSKVVDLFKSFTSLQELNIEQKIPNNFGITMSHILEITEKEVFINLCRRFPEVALMFAESLFKSWTARMPLSEHINYLEMKIDWLIEAGVDFNQWIENAVIQRPVWFYLVDLGPFFRQNFSFPDMKRILDKISEHVNFLVKDPQENNVLCYIYSHEKLGYTKSLIQYLLSKGVDLNETNSQGETPLSISLSRSHIDAVKVQAMQEIIDEGV